MGVEEAMLAEARVEVSYADHKASMVLTALGIGFGAVTGGLLAGDWKPSDQGGGEFAWWVGAILALLSVVIAAAAVWPRYPRRGKSSELFYWRDVASLATYEDFVKQIGGRPPSDPSRTQHQLWELSKIVATKYRLIRAAFVAAGLAGAAFATSAVLA